MPKKSIVVGKGFQTGECHIEVPAGTIVYVPNPAYDGDNPDKEPQSIPAKLTCSITVKLDEHVNVIRPFK